MSRHEDEVKAAFDRGFSAGRAESAKALRAPLDELKGMVGRVLEKVDPTKPKDVRAGFAPTEDTRAKMVGAIRSYLDPRASVTFHRSGHFTVKGCVTITLGIDGTTVEFQ